MRPSVFPALLVALLAACGTNVAGPPADADDVPPAGITTTPSAAPTLRSDDTAAPGDSDNDTDQAADDAGTDAPPAPDASPPAPPADAPVNPPPADVSQSCTAWQDCGPHFGDLNSGFDCEAGQCVCNAAGEHDDACRAIGGYWSDAECFCFVTSSRPPAEADRDPADHVTCWWDWYEECDADVWVDTSYYRRECDSSGRCRDVYVRRGYWRDGHCDDIWVRECSDGTHQEYR